MKKNGFLIKTACPSICLTLGKNRHGNSVSALPNNCHTNIKFTVEFEDNSGTIPSLDILINAILSQLLACTQNGTPSHLSPKPLPNSHFSLFPHPVCRLLFCALVWMNWGSWCYKMDIMDTLMLLSITTLLMLWTGSKANRRIQPPKNFMASLILGLFPQALIASSLFPTKIGSNVPNCQKLCIRLVVATVRIS